MNSSLGAMRTQQYHLSQADRFDWYRACTLLRGTGSSVPVKKNDLPGSDTRTAIKHPTPATQTVRRGRHAALSAVQGLEGFRVLFGLWFWASSQVVRNATSFPAVRRPPPLRLLGPATSACLRTLRTLSLRTLRTHLRTFLLCKFLRTFLLRTLLRTFLRTFFLLTFLRWGSAELSHAPPRGL